GDVPEGRVVAVVARTEGALAGALQGAGHRGALAARRILHEQGQVDEGHVLSFAVETRPASQRCRASTRVRPEDEAAATGSGTESELSGRISRRPASEAGRGD